MSTYFPLAGSNAVIPNLGGQDLYVGANTRYASYASYGSNVSAPSADGRINGVSITALNKRTRTSYASAAECVKTWTGRASAADNNWHSVCWAPELSLFVAVASSGTGNRVMTSPNGITWTARTSAADNDWRGVCWAAELSLFVAVADSGTGNRVMTSPDGIAWTARTSAADNRWFSVCWAAELSLFAAVANSGTGNRVMTSPDGVTWTARTSANDNNWRGVCWAPELSLFVATASSGEGNRVMTSPEGITWTSRTSAADNFWLFVCWAPELSLFVAVATTGTGNRVMTSPDGITWTARTSAADNQWRSVCWAPELSVFVAVADTGVGNRVMTSAIGMPNSKSVVKALPSQMMVDANGNVGIGTGVPLAKLDISGDFTSSGYYLGKSHIAMYRKNNPSGSGIVYTNISSGTMTFNNIFLASTLITKNVDDTNFTFNRAGVYKVTWTGMLISQDSASHELSITPTLTGNASWSSNTNGDVLCISTTAGSDAINGIRFFIVIVQTAGATINIVLTPSSNLSTVCRFKAYGNAYYSTLTFEYYG